MQHYSPDMLISDVLVSHPEAVAVFTSLRARLPVVPGGRDGDARSPSPRMHDVPVESLLEALEAMDRRPRTQGV